jgi:membrane-associated protein
MEALYSNFFDYILHFDRYLPLVMEQYGHWIYAILFTIVFCETGLVVTPFLPGDSLLFACGALAATAGGLDLTTLVIIFLVSAILGDACNYMIGEEFGHRILRNYPKLIKPQHIQKAEAFYAKHGHKAIFLDSCFDLQSQFNAMTADLIIKSVCKKSFKLQAQQASFGQYSAALLHDRAEIVF